MNSRIAQRATCLGLALALAAAGPSSVAGQETDRRPRPFIEVSGQAQVSVPSDRATVRFAVETRAEAAADAAARNADRMDAVVRALRDLGIEGTRIETSGYSLNPIYRRPERGEPQQVIDGYQAMNHVVLTLDDVEAVGSAIDAGIAAGANRVAGLSFEARDTEEARLGAVRLAVEKARAEAGAMAAALGVELGPPIEVRGGANAPVREEQQYARTEAMNMDMAAPTPVEPGRHSVWAHVTVKFLLRPGS